MRIPTENEIIALDDELAARGVPVDDRANQALQRWLKRTHWSSDFIPIAKHFDERFAALHPSVKMEGRPFMFLCASTRGISYEYHPPIVFGQTMLNPIDPLQISRGELERIWKTEPAAYWDLFYQCCDCFDLFSAHLDNVIVDSDGLGFAAAAKDQLQASARQLVAMASDTSLTQACSLASELTGKAVLKQLGFGDVKPLGHDVKAIYAELVRLVPALTDAEMVAATARIPDYVKVRYSPPALSTKEAQALFAATLFLCSDAFRRISRQSMYFTAVQDSAVPDRQWA